LSLPAVDTVMAVSSQQQADEFSKQNVTAVRTLSLINQIHIKQALIGLTLDDQAIGLYAAS